MKAALADIKMLGILELPNLLSIMDGFVYTNLTVDDLITLAATVYTVNPGPMPTLTAQNLADAGHVSPVLIVPSHGPYNQNQGTLPNVMVRGCLFSSDGSTYGLNLVSQNYAAFTDLQDGILNTTPWVCDDGS